VNVARSLVKAPVELTVKLEIGVDVPSPSLPFDPKLNIRAPVEEAIARA